MAPPKGRKRRKNAAGNPGRRTIKHSSEVMSDSEAISAMQKTYAQRRVDAGNIPPAIMRKYNLMQQLIAKERAGKATEAEKGRAIDLAIELLPYFHFKVDDMGRG